MPSGRFSFLSNKAAYLLTGIFSRYATKPASINSHPTIFHPTIRINPPEFKINATDIKADSAEIKAGVEAAMPPP